MRDFRVVNSFKLADGIFELALAPADQVPLFAFTPGQFVMLHLLNADGSVWAKSAYSISSAPADSSETIKLAIKIRGEFTQRAQQLKAGDAVKVQGPFGKFILPKQASHLVMLAGGIGIAPFRSMIRAALDAQPACQVTLFYSCKTLESMAYYDELMRLGAYHPEFKPVCSLTGYAPQDWTGETGRIGAQLFQKHVSEPANATFLVCGSREFVQDMADMLKKSGVDIEHNLFKEMF